MDCPKCQAELPATEIRCRFCGARVAEAAGSAFGPRPRASQADAEECELSAAASPQMRMARSPVSGGPRPLARPRRPAAPPGANLAVASLICGLAGVLLMCPLVFPVGAVLGVLALRDLPADAERTPRLQAQWGMWIGIIGAGLSVLVLGMFVLLLVLGALGAAAGA